MGAFSCLLLLADFWRSLQAAPYDKALEQGARLVQEAAAQAQTLPSVPRHFPVEVRALYAQAAAAFLRAAELRPDDAEAPFLAAHAFERAEDYEAALRQYEESRRRQPDGPRADGVAFELGILYSRLGRFEQAISEYERALRMTQAPYERASLYINAAESLMALGRLDEAIVLYRRGVEIGTTLAQQGPLSPSAQALHLIGLAVALDRDEQEEKAFKTARRALELDPTLSELYGPNVFFVPEGDIEYYAALQALVRGHSSEAGSHFAQFLRLVPKSPFALRARAHLRALGVAVPAAAPEPEPGSALAPAVQNSPSPAGVSGVVHARGPLTTIELDAAMKRYQPAVFQCFRGWPGNYSLSVDVAASGRVERIRLEPVVSEAASCLQSAASSFRFRVADHPKPTHFQYRLLIIAP